MHGLYVCFWMPVVDQILLLRCDTLRRYKKRFRSISFKKKNCCILFKLKLNYDNEKRIENIILLNLLTECKE